MNGGADPERHSLDAVGRLHYAVHAALRDLGYPGFACQLHIWLAGRLDPAVLRRALDNLALRYPLLAARLSCEPGRLGDIYWERRAGARCPLTVVALEAGGEGSVPRYAESLMATPFDLAQGEPLALHLLQLPDGRDVLIVHYDHTLISDAHAATLLIEELNALNGVPPDAVRSAQSEPDEIGAWLKRHRLRTRWARALRVIAASARRRKSLKLLPGDAQDPAHDGCRISLRTLDEARTRAFAERVRRACGFPNLSMGFLASAFRALHVVTGSPTGRKLQLATGVGYSLRPASRDRALFRTFGSEMILKASLDELADKDELTRVLVRRMRDQIRRGFDLGSLQLAGIASRHLELVRRGFKRRMRDLSFSYGYFKAPDESGAGLCGVPIARAYHLIMPWAPPGLTVSANACHGRLHISVTSAVQAIPAPLAETFADTLLADL